jgi:hypothetical protein
MASIVIPTTVFQQFYDNAGATLASSMDLRTMQVNTSAGGWSPKWKASTVAAATLFQASPYMLGQTMNTPTTSQAQVPTPSVPTSYVDQRLLDAKLEAVEARTETKFAQLLGELKVISANVANLGSQIGDVKTELGSKKCHCWS